VLRSFQCQCAARPCRLERTAASAPLYPFLSSPFIMAVAERRSPDSSIAIYARSAAIASGLAALLVVYLALSSSPTPVEQEAEPTVVKMKDWRLSGGAAKREMARFFDNQNAVSEVCCTSRYPPRP